MLLLGKLCHRILPAVRRAAPGDSSKPPTSGEAFDLLSRSCVCAESPELCTRLRVLAVDAIIR